MLKMKAEHYEHIKSEMAKIDKSLAKAHYEGLKQDSRVKDLDMRFRWDCFYVMKLSQYACDNLYSYLNDSHIDSALKRIVKELELV